MACNIEERMKTFTSCFVDEFEMYIEVQRIIMEDGAQPNEQLKNIATNAITALLSSSDGFVGKTVGNIKEYILQHRKLDIAGKMINLINKYRNIEEKKVIRAMLVRVAYELFRSFECQFMQAEKSHGGWSLAMLQLARTAVWCFMHYYKFNAQDELDEKYLLEGITLKNMPAVGLWKKWYYKDEKKFTKVTNTKDHLKFDGVKMYSKAGLILIESRQRYFANDLTKPVKYGYRRFFTHENYATIKTEYDEVQQVQINYQYQIDMGTSTKEDMCAKILKTINDMDESLLEDRLLENIKRITENVVENLMCEIMQQITATLNGIAMPVATSTTTFHTETTSNTDVLCHSQKANKMQNIFKSTFSGTVNMNL